MNPPDDLIGSWSASFASTSTGWDFSAVADGMSEPGPPWDFDVLSQDALAATDAAVDMGTGGGEQLIRLVKGLQARGLDRPAVVATEGWPPNVPVATANLAPYGIPVLVHDADTDERMPFGDESLDLVLNRHEAYSPTEVHRVLRPGGRYLFLEHVRSPDNRAVARMQDVLARPHRIIAAGCHPNRDLEALLDQSSLEVQTLTRGIMPRGVPTVRPLIWGTALAPA